MKLTIDGVRNVDVVDVDCPARPCYRLGFDKGSFTQGVGYTSYHAGGERAVCFTRHLRGCPHKPPDGSGVAKLLDPLPCCDAMRVRATDSFKPQPMRQRCLGCGRWLRGTRLEMARSASA